MSHPEPQYQPEILERFAARVERRACSVVRRVTLAGGLLGGAAGALPLTPVGQGGPVPHTLGFATVALGTAAGALIALVGARHRAGLLRLRAQSTLCQLHAQRTTFALWLLLKDHGFKDSGLAALEHVYEVAPVALPDPEPEPEPVAVPVPLALAEPEPEPLPRPAVAPAPLVPAFALAAVPTPPPVALAPAGALPLTPTALPPVTVVPLPPHPPLAPVALPSAPATPPVSELSGMPPLSPRHLVD